MLTWLLLAVAPASAQDIAYNATIQGGISVDTSGVSTNYSGGSTWRRAPQDLVVQIPPGATVSRIFATLTSKATGFNGDPAGDAAINGVALSSATLRTTRSYYRVYELNPSTFRITGPGSYRYEERDRADVGYQSGNGISGVTLAVVYTDTTRNGRRHVVFGAFDSRASWKMMKTM